MVKMKARKSFLSNDQKMIIRGVEFQANEGHAKGYEKRNLAYRIDTTPLETKPEYPPEDNSEMKHLGAGWYEVRGQRVRGKENAEAILREGDQ